jgi:hypothetical protein
MFPPLNEQRCSGCRYFFPDQHDLGQCRRNPPQIGPRGGQWPTVAADDWCGEWVAREGRP